LEVLRSSKIPSESLYWSFHFRTAVERSCKVRPLFGIPETFRPLPEVKDGKIGEVPTLKDLGVEDHSEGQDPRTAFPFLGGESAGIKRIEEYFWKTDNVAKYKETRNGLIGAVRLGQFQSLNLI
jgi:deoxyribodipyrimidine photo-lyase